MRVGLVWAKRFVRWKVREVRQPKERLAEEIRLGYADLGRDMEGNLSTRRSISGTMTMVRTPSFES